MTQGDDNARFNIMMNNMVLIVRESDEPDSKAHAFVLERRTKSGVFKQCDMDIVFTGRNGYIDAKGKGAKLGKRQQRNNNKDKPLTFEEASKQLIEHIEILEAIGEPGPRNTYCIRKYQAKNLTPVKLGTDIKAYSV